ncbi:MAG: tetratricopeptide repeat protein [Gaiellaceae bacterium]
MLRRRVAGEALRGARRSLAVAVGAGVALLPIAASNGGYFPTSWGWSALVFAWVALLALLLGRDVELGRAGVVFAASTAALCGWVWLSAAWSQDVPQTVLEGERALVYVTAVAALLLLVRAGRRDALLAGVLGAIVLVCTYSLATRLLPERLGVFDSLATYRLATPVGYWNALGIFAAIGMLVALGFVARARTLAARAAGSASLVILAPTLHFTYSRGAWLSLWIALAVALLLDPRRLQQTLALAAALPAPAVAVLLAWRSRALSTVGSSLPSAAHDGHRLAAEVAGLAVVAALLGAALGAAERRFHPVRRLRVVYAVALLLALVVALSAVFVRYGSPPTIAKRAWGAFVTPPPNTGSNLNGVLSTFSGAGRIVAWRSALREFHTAPASGTGAGTYESWWLAHRGSAGQMRDAHNIYVETLAELGAVGLALLLLMLATPLVAAWRARQAPLVPFAAAAFAAWIVHAGVDWDWEVPAVTLAALACGAACVFGVEGGAPRPIRPLVRGLLAAVAVAVSGFALVAAIGNGALARSDSALRAGNFAQAEENARTAARWAPWAADPQVLLGEIEAMSFRRIQARRTFEDAIRKEPLNYLAWYGLAGVESGAARLRAAAEVVRLNPASAEAGEMRALLGSRS